MPSITSRRLFGAAFAGGVLVVAAGSVFAALGLVGWADAVLLVAVSAGVAGIALTGVMVRRLAGHVTRTERRLRTVIDDGLEDAAERLLAAAGELRLEAAELSRRMAALEEAGRTGLQRVEADAAGLSRRMTGLSRRMAALEEAGRAGSDRVEAVAAEMSRRMTELRDAGRTDFLQAEALGDLRELLSPRAPMPSSRGWAASPDVLRELVGVVLERRPKLVVECGSGASSLWLGYALERAGEGRLVALEHDERYAELSRDLVRAHGLEHIVEIRHAPLRPWPDATSATLWYDTEVLADLTEIGQLFVDGPPERTGPQARYPAGPVLLPRCVDDAVIVLDDANRAGEREASDRWLEEHPYLERTERAFEKGAHVFTRRA